MVAFSARIAYEKCRPSNEARFFAATSRDNGFSFKEVKAGWLSHPGNPHGKLLPLNIP
jgi:hypothetical protein